MAGHDPFHGKHYEFILTSSTNNNNSRSELIIREIDNEQNTLELVQPSNFADLIAPSFIVKYTHWLDTKKQIVYFKRRQTEDSHYDLPPDFTLTKVDPYWIFKNLKTKTCILSINSKGFDKVSNALSRLEEKPDINLVLDETTGQLTALLPRYQLSFLLDHEGYLCSVEYHDFRISEVQVLGTLVGLQQGILMENQIHGKNGTAFTKELALIPHGQIEVTAGALHQTTRITLSSLRSPKFFAYEVDPILKRLVGGKSKPAWLHLAALHAATSSSLPDPFTGLTGTEMAMWILQSAMVWSGSPYDDESLETLATIRGFSPERSYYGINPRRLDIEVLSWPRGLNELAAFDGFEIIVERLLRDSSQLSFLFPRSKKLEEALNPRKDRQEGKEQLRIRSYLRSLPFYNQDVSVKEDFIPKSYKSHIGSAQKIPCFHLRRENNCERLVSISQIRFAKDNIIHPSTLNFLQMCQLGTYLISSKPLSAPAEIKSVVGYSLESLFQTDMRERWLSLYEYARSGKSRASQEEYLAWSAFLSSMAYTGHPMEQIVALHLISLFADTISFPQVPDYTEPSRNGVSKLTRGYSSPSTNAYSRQEIKAILDSNGIGFRDRRKKVRINPSTGYYEDEDYDDYSKELRSYNAIQANDFEAIVTTVASQWPCDRVGDEGMFSGSNCKYREALELVNQKLNFWYNNHKLKLFVEEVETVVKSGLCDLVSQKLETPSALSVDIFGVLEQKMTTASVSIDTKKVLPLEEFLTSLPSGNELNTATAVFESGKIEDLDHLHLEGQHETLLSTMENHFDLISRQMTNAIDKEILFITGIAPRATPLFLTQLLTNEKIKENSLMYNFIGALVVHYVTLKKIRRCIRFKSKEDTFAIELKRELENELHENWSPAENPEWLLLELELDLMIRPVQVEVARQMMRMPNGGNGVMQLNMGEGKTSVIVPMLCATLSNEKTLCRVTVLNSIFKTNFNILAFAIGGLLNRRLCTVPCRRDMNIEVADIHKIAKLYKQCLRMKGVILTLPEYRLSFRLKIFDSIIKTEEALGLELLEVENWLRDHARDILDESDELLSVKYQLVYTIGTQVLVDGGSMRWTICQDLLRIIQQIAMNVSAKHGSSVIEFENETKRDHPEQFAHFRILKDSCHAELTNAVTDILLKEMMLPETLKQIVRRFLTEESIPREVHSELMGSFEDTPDLLTKILLYFGYIRRGVLTLALTKRWRVEYGVDPNGRRRMAVPFRAKDVAAERTEFGHPDLAIVLTHLSYYYSGLSDPQLLECFECLEKKIDPEIIYRSWIQPIADNVPKFLLNYRGLNINDLVQRSLVFDVLRKHKAVIDFWLDHKVFPRESKQFPGKIVMTAWDLCYERNKYPTTGFSGTNDSSVLLPLPISQQDLPQLLRTNEELEKVLLQPENKNLTGLRMGVTCKEILEKMTKDNLRVLIDAGALMLDCDNEQVAQLWLEVDPGIEASVYFNKDNEIMVKSRADSQKTNGPRHKPKDIPLELSPFGGRLGQCGVFLDDQHTRATDLKFPVGSKACVTVGTRMRRDKLMQACMRMRKLGQGHSVSFYLSHEAFDKVMGQQMKPLTILGEQSNDVHMENATEVVPQQIMEPIRQQPQTEDVIHWVTSNTKQFNEDGLPYWAVAGKNYVQKLSAEDLFPLQKHIQHSASILANQCEDEEVTLLKELYGIYTKNELLVQLIPRWFAQTKEKLHRHNSSIPIPPQILSNIDSICSSVVSRCEDNAPEKMHLACLVDEEQEKELEKEAEIEEEREVNRPKAADEVQPSLHQNVVNVVYYGIQIEAVPGIQKLSGIFNNTSFSNEVQPGCWGNQVFATDDFISVIKIYSARFKTDSHLRPVEYLTIRENQEPGADPQILLLSPFEVNALLPDFRKKGRTALRLHMFTPRTFEKQDLLLNNIHLQLPHPSKNSGVSLSEESKTMAALSLASGNLYFDTMEEQKAFARFLGLVPKPWEGVEPRAFEEGKITKTGFLLPEFRESLWEYCKVEASAFSTDPITLVKKILERRHAVVGEVAHVMKLLDKNLYVEIN